MEKSIITTGKNIDLAIAAALEQLCLDRDSVSVEVLENAKEEAMMRIPIIHWRNNLM